MAYFKLSWTISNGMVLASMTEASLQNRVISDELRKQDSEDDPFQWVREPPRGGQSLRRPSSHIFHLGAPIARYIQLPLRQTPTPISTKGTVATRPERLFFPVATYLRLSGRPKQPIYIYNVSKRPQTRAHFRISGLDCQCFYFLVSSPQRLTRNSPGRCVWA